MDKNDYKYKAIKDKVKRGLGILLCLFRGHFYRPSCEFKYRKGKRPHIFLAERFRYTCETCGMKTNWMTRVKHEEFIQKYHPTWGRFGSDSQGTRRKALETT